MPTTLAIPDSARLRYRLMDARDKEFWFELDQDPEVMRFLNDGKPTAREDFDGWMVQRYLSFTDPAAGHGLWELADRNGGEPLGWILVRNYRFDKPDCEYDNVEFGWRVKRSHWGQGFATEAARAIMDVLQLNPAIRVFSALAHPDNLASTSIMTKLGMRYIEDRDHIVRDRRYPAAYYEVPSPNFNGRPPA